MLLTVKDACELHPMARGLRGRGRAWKRRRRPEPFRSALRRGTGCRSNTGTHRFIFTSQNLTATGAETSISVPDLSDEAIGKIVEQRASAVAGKLKGLSAPTQSLLRNPANLLVVIHLLEEGRSVPETEYDLYRSVVDPLKEKWLGLGTISNLTDIRRIAASFAETGQADVLAARQFPDEQALLAARLLIRRNGRLFFLSDRIAAFLVADALVEDPSAIGSMKPVLNGQWRLIMEMVGQKVNAAGADALIASLIQTASTSSVTLAEHLVAAAQTHTRPEFGEAWSAPILLAIARARQRLILAEAGRDAAVTM